MVSYMDSYSLKSVLDLPPPFRSLFSFRYFNSLQSECFSGCFLSDINMVISAPTGSGKTVLFELCVLRLLSRFLSAEGKLNHVKGTLKTKFDAVTRHGIRDGDLSFFSDIALVLIDEVHLLNDPRGAALEAIVSRIKMLSRIPEMSCNPLAKVRFVAVSATIPNIDDLAEWLLVPSEGIKRFGEETRQVKLTTKVYGYASARNDFYLRGLPSAPKMITHLLFHPSCHLQRLQNFIFDILMQHSKGRSVLIFCSTRKGAQEAAQCLSKIATSLGHSNPFISSREQQERLKEASLSCADKQMQSYILYGVGYHNGGLCAKDRNLVEGLFLKGDLLILCTTNTLAHGINLPAHTVIIKSTQYFNKEKGLYMEYERSMILQMCGRAGRPPFDDTGTVIIMTRKETAHLYENLLNGCELVESQLLSCAIEHLNAEIVQLTVSDISLAIEWLKSSYLYVRIKKNPEKYGMKRGIPCEHLEKHMRAICVEKIRELTEYGMIWADEYGFLLKPLEPAKLMTKFYLKFNTMKLILKAPGSCNVEDALQIVSRSEELSWIQLRRNEKKILNDTNSDKNGRLKFHVIGDNGKKKRRIQTKEEKIFLLANDCLTGDALAHDLSLSQDVNSICTNGCRIAKCMKDLFIHKKNYKAIISSAILARSLSQRLWDDSPYLLKQLPGIGMVTAKALRSAGICTFESMAEADPRKIEIVTARKYPFGNQIKESLLSLPPKVDLKMEEADCKRQGKSKLTVTVTRTQHSATSTKRHFADMLVGSEEDNIVLFHEKIRVTVKADLLYEEYVGLDVHEKLVITNGVRSTMDKGILAVPCPTYTLPKEIVVIEDEKSPSEVIFEKLKDLKKLEGVCSSIPSFDLLQEEEHADVLILEPGETSCKMVTEDSIFDHIRKKSKILPSIASSKAMEFSDPCLVLTTKGTPKGHVGVDNIITTDSEYIDSVLDLNAINSLAQAGEGACMHDTIFRKASLKASPKPLQTGSCFVQPSSVSQRQYSFQHSSGNTQNDHREPSFLGFKSVFSFL